MLSRLTRIFVLSLVVLTIASSVFAARRSSLGGNLLITDSDDVFAFPHTALQYVRSVTFDLGATSSQGSGGMIFGSDEFAFGAFSHRGDFLGAVKSAYTTNGDIDDLSNMGSSSFGGSLTGVAPVGGALQWLDVMAAWNTADMPWGLRVSVGRNNNNPVGDNDQSDVTSFNFVLSTQFNDIDATAEFSLADASTTDPNGGTPVTTEATPFGFTLGLRKAATEESDDLQLAWLGMVSFGSNQVDNGTTQTDLSSFDFQVGAGPAFKPNDRTQLAMYGTFEFMRKSDDDNVGTEETTNNTVIPGWHLAGEIELASWLQARAGMVSRFAFMNKDTETTLGTAEEDSNNLDFSWHTGLGVQIDDFMLDLYVHPNVITSGTALFGDNTTTFGMATASFSF